MQSDSTSTTAQPATSSYYQTPDEAFWTSPEAAEDEPCQDCGAIGFHHCAVSCALEFCCACGDVPKRRGRPFKKGFDPRRHVFTQAECIAGFWAALEALTIRYNDDRARTFGSHLRKAGRMR